MAQRAVKAFGASIQLACQAFQISQACYRYQAKHQTENDVIANWLVRLTDNNRNWGFGLCFLCLRNVRRFAWNRKRVYRIYKELELNLRIKPGKPQQNAYVERFNRTVRYEWLSQYHWTDLDEVRLHATQWMWMYNHERPNMALGGITPKQRLPMAALYRPNEFLLRC